MVVQGNTQPALNGRREFFRQYAGIVLREEVSGYIHWYPDVVNEYLNVIDLAIECIHKEDAENPEPQDMIQRMRGWVSVRRAAVPNAADTLRKGFPDLDASDIDELVHLCSGNVGADYEKFCSDVFRVLAFDHPYRYIGHSGNLCILTFFYPADTYDDATIQDIVREYVIVRELQCRRAQLQVFQAPHERAADR